jgi:hypothetical protein
MSTVFDMAPSVTLPRFAPSSKSAAPQSGAGTAVFPDGGDFDFDLLAEYLLDEGTSAEGDDSLGLSAFDFRYVNECILERIWMT